MFKRISHIILSFVLLVSTMGMAVSKHYCGEDLISVSVFNSENDACCDMDDCCQNENQIYQVKEDFSIPPVSTIPVLAELDILGHDLIAGTGLIGTEKETKNTVFDESPRLLPLQKTLALKQVYRL
jgi:hypothetical protein